MRLVLAIAAVVAAFGASSAHAAGETWLEFYADTTVDAAGTPDVTNLIVGGADDRTLSVNLRATFKTIDTASVFVDTDATATTGGPGGAELRVDFTDHGNRTSFAAWKSGAWQSVRIPTALILPPNLDVLFGPTAVLEPQSLGDPTAVNLWAEATGGGRTDRLPDSGTIHYDVRPLTLTVASFKTTAAKLRERLQLVVDRSDSGRPLTGALPLCTARVGKRVVFAKLAADGKTTAPAALCDWRFPKSLAGKRATATMVVTYAGRTVKRSVTFTVHR